MDQIRLKYGKGTVKLTKSDRLVGIKPNRQMSAATRAAVAPKLAGLPQEDRTLGGFQVLNVDSAPMEKTLDELRESPAVDAGTHVYHTSDDNVPFVPTGEIYIEWTPDAPVEARHRLLHEHHLEIVDPRGEDTVVTRITPQSSNPVKTAAALQDSDIVSVAEPDLATPGQLHQFAVPADPLLDRQWHLRNTGQNNGSTQGLVAGADARVVAAWQRAETLGSAQVVVAVIDDGFDLTHPDFQGTGKIVAPWDFTRLSDDPRPEPNLFDHDQGDWHGTACAGVSVGNANGTGILGSAPGCRLMPVRWGPNLAPSQVEAWFDYVREQGAWVVSCSWGAAAAVFPLAQRISRAIERCAREGRGGLGTVICFAAGNSNHDINDEPNGSLDGFAIHPDVIAVAASTSMDERSDYSNFGDAIWICAPSSGAGGRRITTADVRGSYQAFTGSHYAGYSPGDYTDSFGGTSSATPLVAGICGLLLSIQPDLPATQVREILRDTARPIGSQSDYDGAGHSRFFGYGCINALAAVDAALASSRAETAPEIAPAWGREGHFTTNGKAVEAVPAELRSFYMVNLAEIEQRSIEADQAKGSDPTEPPRHFIDIDLYGEYPFGELPEDYDDAVAQYGESVVIGRGILPWIIDQRHQSLVTAFERKDRAAILEHSAWLGHYIGDAHVPLHTTANHNGQLTGQRGLHSHFENAVLRFVEPGDVRPVTGAQLNRPVLTLAFEWIRESHTFLPEILAADRATTRGRRRDLPAFAARVRHIAIDQLTKGATRLASLWFSAWNEARQPNIETLSAAAGNGRGPARRQRGSQAAVARSTRRY